MRGSCVVGCPDAFSLPRRTYFRIERRSAVDQRGRAVTEIKMRVNDGVSVMRALATLSTSVSSSSFTVMLDDTGSLHYVFRTFQSFHIFGVLRFFSRNAFFAAMLQGSRFSFPACTACKF